MKFSVSWSRVHATLWTIIVLGIGMETHGASVNLRQRGTWPGYSRGDARQVTVAGDYAFVTAGGLQVVSLNPQAELKVVSGALRGETLRQVAVGDGYAVGVGTLSLRVVDISDPTQPRQVGGYTNGWGYGSVALAGRYAYLTPGTSIGSSGFFVFDLRELSRPRLAGSCETAKTFNSVKVFGGRLYAQTGQDLLTYDLTAPTEPRLLGKLTVETLNAGFTVVEHRVYVAGFQSMTVLDWSDPTQPQVLGRWSGTSQASRTALAESGLERACLFIGYPIAVDGGYAYLGDGDSGVRVLDVSDPARPRYAGRFKLEQGKVFDVAATAGTVLVAAGSAGVAALDASDPAALKQRATCLTANDARKVAAEGRYACLAGYTGGLTVLDISNPDQPRWAGEYSSDSCYYGVAMSGHYVLLANHGAGIDVLDLSQDGRPVRVGRYDDGGSSRMTSDIAASGGLACLVGGDDTLRTLDIRDPIQPKDLGQCALPLAAARVTLAGTRAYVSALGGGVAVVDISEPSRPRVVGKWLEGRGLNQTMGQGDQVFVVDGAGMKVLRLSAPDQLRGIATFNHALPVNDLAVTGDLTYLAAGDGILALDLSTPTRPQLLASALGANAKALAATGQSLCVSLGPEGFVLFDAAPWPPRLSVRADGSGFRVVVQGEAGQTLAIQGSEDLTLWTDWQQVTATGEPQELTDTRVSGTGARYYRALVARAP